MRIQGIENLLRDLAVEFGAELPSLLIIDALLNKKRGRARQLGSTSTTAVPPSIKNLPKALMQLGDTTKGGSQEKVREASEWITKLHRLHRAELAGWDVEDLKSLFLLPADIRTGAIEAITGPIPVSEVKKILNWAQDNLPRLDDETKDIIQEWKNWADEILNDPSMP